MENSTENRSIAPRLAYEAPELEVALVWGGGVRTENYVYLSDEADTSKSADELGLFS